MHHCKENNILFHNEDQFSQTLLLRKMANELRSLCNLPSYDVVYDPLDASAIVSNLASGESSVLKSSILGATFDIPLNDVDQVLPSLNSKYGKLLKSIPVKIIWHFKSFTIIVLVSNYVLFGMFFRHWEEPLKLSSLQLKPLKRNCHHLRPLLPNWENRSHLQSKKPSRMVVWMLLETEVNRQSRRVPLENFNFTYFIQSCQ